MKNLVWKVILMLAVMNAASFLGASAAGKQFEFNLIFNLVTPILCGLAAWQAEQKKARQH